CATSPRRLTRSWSTSGTPARGTTSARTTRGSTGPRPTSPGRWSITRSPRGNRPRLTWCWRRWGSPDPLVWLSGFDRVGLVRFGVPQACGTFGQQHLELFFVEDPQTEVFGLGRLGPRVVTDHH